VKKREGELRQCKRKREGKREGEGGREGLEREKESKK
jgi:hypothetical protein